MNEKNRILTGMIGIAFFMLVFSFVVGLIMFITGEKTNDIILAFGVIGILGLATLFFTGIILNNVKPSGHDDNHEYYVSLVDLADSDPNKFNKKFNWLVSAGTRYVILLFTLIFISMVGVLAIGLNTGRSVGGFGVFIAGLFVVLYIVIKSLFIKSESLSGFEIFERDYPKLFELIDFARNKFNAPKLDKVLMYPGENCAVCKNPIGFGFRNENAMTIGIYLLELLDEDELKSIFVHEFAHIYNKDTDHSNKINKRIIKWSKILEATEKKGIIAKSLLTDFSENYIIKMQMYASAISKSKEIIADLEAVKFTSTKIYYIASLKLELIQYFFNKPLEENQIDLRTYENPPKDFFNFFIEEFLRNFTVNEKTWTNQIQKRMSTKYDTHPSFNERMDKIGINDIDYKIDFSGSYEIKQEVCKIISQFNAEWYENAKENWSEYTEEYKKANELVENFKMSENNDENMEYGLALENISRLDEALNLYSKLIEINIDNAPAIFRKGIILLNSNEESGIEFIRKSMELNNEFIDSGLQVIAEFLLSNGLSEKKEELKEWAIEKAEIARKKLDETDSINTYDTFIEAKLSQEQRELLFHKLSEIQSVKTAMIATKELKYSAHDLLVVGITSKQNAENIFVKGMEIQDVDLLVSAIESLEISYFLLDLHKNLIFTKPLKLIKNSELIKR